MPSFLAVFIILTAISPLFATRILEKRGGEEVGVLVSGRVAKGWWGMLNAHSGVCNGRALLLFVEYVDVLHMSFIEGKKNRAIFFCIAMIYRRSPSFLTQIEAIEGGRILDTVGIQFPFSCLERKCRQRSCCRTTSSRELGSRSCHQMANVSNPHLLLSWHTKTNY